MVKHTDTMVTVTALTFTLFAATTHDRDRTLPAFAVPAGARASELLGVIGEHVDWAAQQISYNVNAVGSMPDHFRPTRSFDISFGILDFGLDISRQVAAQDRIEQPPHRRGEFGRHRPGHQGAVSRRVRIRNSR